MNIIWQIILLLILVANYSYGRYAIKWVRTNDQPLIDESLKAATAHHRFDQYGDDLQSKITNIVCKARIFNGIRIKLYFEIEKQVWKCLLYKPLVQALGIYCENCTQVTDENSLEEFQLQHNDKIDHEKPQVNDERQKEETDDEAKIDEIHQHGEEKETNNDETNNDETNNDEPQADNNNQQAHNEHLNQQPGFERDTDENEKVSNENQDDDETNIDTNHAEQKINQDEDVPHKDIDNTHIQNDNQ
ncbi:unnamed protein product [Rotaria socialis]|uniref:Uncharacterized protein n=1 Tax=Rotaria socialis TaxID=392032 RepID=A0A820YNR4_9BILA|nr:unnamed protein product [Rotaria socialis]CAF3485584.1 unnamed protein product [Rotaria socialis]CAF3612294.1 unnamed protein product [Rotaria socialis]CAF3641076.1 unnamed protein product [Rotaria socialis]CAF3642380.1 unnamed protein product [Rotaria socialis]